MTTQALHFNPFAQLVSPADVLAALGRSEGLSALHSKIHRPLDRPFLPCFQQLAAIDAEIDAMPDEVFEDNFDDLVQAVSTPELWG